MKQRIYDIPIDRVTLTEMAQDYKELGREYIQICWHVSDVQEIRPDLTEDEAYRVLLEVLSEHDSRVGINWDVIEEMASVLYPE